MDTISRENNSMLPIFGIVVGVIALLLGGYAAIKLSQVNTKIAAHDEKVLRIEGIEAQVNKTAEDTARANKQISDYANQTRAALGEVSNKFAEHQVAIEALKKPVIAAPPAGKAPAGPVVAAPGEYVVKAKDTGVTIARANGTTLSDLTKVNPDVNWNKLQPGDKVKLPLKK